MSKACFIIVRQPVEKSAQNYLGMDRDPFGSHTDVPEPLVLEGMALLDVPSEKVEISYRTFWKKLCDRGYDQYDLLALGAQHGDDWEFLGYDVGEKTERCWSVITHWNDFLEPEAIKSWQIMLNHNGLFTDLSDAKALLAVYLNSNDPDMGWATDGWGEQPDWYDVIPIYRYRTVS